MRNYAVLESGTNGNLETSTQGFVKATIPCSDDIYWELSTGGSTGSTIESLTGVADYEVNINWTVNTNSWVAVGLVKTNNEICINGRATSGVTTAIPFLNNGVDNVTGSIVSALYKPSTSKIHFAVNGRWINSDLSEDINGYGDGFEAPVGWRPFIDSKNLNSRNAVVNFGQQPFAAPNVTHNLDAGTVVIDGETYGTLYQTWEQWARTALGYALDRIAKLEQQRASDLATIAELRTQVESALERIGAIESDEVSDDAVDTVLLTSVADLITRVEALESP